MALDPRYLKGVEHFNEGDYFDAHEIWEELWHEETGNARAFLQGLIQTATALHHFRKGNLKGAKTLYESGTRLLNPYREVFWGFPVGKFLDELAQCFQELLSFHMEDLPGRYDSRKNRFLVRLNENLIPKIKLLNEGSEKANGAS